MNSDLARKVVKRVLVAKNKVHITKSKNIMIIIKEITIFNILPLLMNNNTILILRFKQIFEDTLVDQYINYTI